MGYFQLGRYQVAVDVFTTFVVAGAVAGGKVETVAVAPLGGGHVGAVLFPGVVYIFARSYGIWGFKTFSNPRALYFRSGT